MTMAKGIGGALLMKLSVSLIAMSNEQNHDLTLLVNELEGVKARQKSLEAREEEIKKDILEVLQATGETEWTTPKGKVTLQSRSSKVYGEAVVRAELQYKTLKKLADDMGDYEQKPGKTSVVFNFAKTAKDEEAF